jgi:hypothetical protein
VRRACSFRAEGKKIGVVVPKEQDDDTPKKTFELGPDAPLPLDTAWALRCDESLTGVEGSLPPKPFELAFRTYGPMRVVKVSPAGYDVNLDEVELGISLNSPLRKGASPSHRAQIDGFPAYVLDGRASLAARALSR